MTAQAVAWAEWACWPVRIIATEVIVGVPWSGRAHGPGDVGLELGEVLAGDERGLARVDRQLSARLSTASKPNSL
jgi:hypothetical protein